MAERRAKGTGSLRINEDGTKTLILAVANPATGKWTKLQVTAPSETACNKKMKQKLADWQEAVGDIGDAAKLTVDEACKTYLEYQVAQNLIKRTTRDRNEVTIVNQISGSKLGKLQTGTVKSKDIDEHFVELISNSGLSSSTIEKAMYILDATFTWLVSREQISKNPVDSVRSKIKKNLSSMNVKNADDTDVLVMTSVEEADFLFEAEKKKPNGEYINSASLHARFLLMTGMRVGEYIALRWSDYDPKSRMLTINKTRHQVKKNESGTVVTNYIASEGSTKNKKARNIILLDDAARILSEIRDKSRWTDPDDYICLNSRGNNYTDTSMEHAVSTIYKHAGLRPEISGLHVLRRTFATKMFRKGFSVKDVAAYIGDEERTVSKYYVAARETTEVNGKVVAVVSLDSAKVRANNI